MKKYVLKKSNTATTAWHRDLEKELNPSQCDAVLHTEGPVLVIAGAGSGKTKTITYRVAHLINTGVPPESILLLTFTRKAAQEMLKRATHLLDHRCHRVSGGTFHAFANIIIRQYASNLGFDPQFTILDRGDSEELINKIRKELHPNTKDKRFPRKSTIATILGRSTNTGQSITEILGKQYPHFLGYSDILEKIHTTYQIRKQLMQLMDYDDLLSYLLQLLVAHPDVATQLQKQFRYIMVDEYQDTNKIQASIIQELSKTHGNIFVVGDDSQSIYSFRGAHFKNIIQFPTLFPETKIITLSTNYRSFQPILSLTNELISHSKEKFSKTLVSHRKGGEKPVFIEAGSDNEQSNFICQKILELREDDVPLSDIAILMRSGWHSNDLEIELKSHDIPFKKVGGIRFIEAAHIKDLMCFLRVIYNPKDLLCWQRLLCLVDGVGPKSAETIIAMIQEGRKLSDISQKLSKKHYKDRITTLLNALLSTPQTSKPSEVIEKAIALYTPFFKLKYDDFPKRLPDLESLQVISERFETLESFLTEISLEPPDSSDAKATDKDDESAMTLSTIHSAKGLEWHTVFIMSCIDGYIPSFQSLDDPEQIEEERRLLYVAMTRAKNQLFILKPNIQSAVRSDQAHAHWHIAPLSRFLSTSELLESYTEKWILTEDHSDMSYDIEASFDDNDHRKYSL